MVQRYVPQQEEYPVEIYDSTRDGPEFSPAYMNQPQQTQQQPKQVRQYQQNQQRYQNLQNQQENPKIKNKGVDITFRYSEQTQTYKKLRIEKDGDNFLLVVIEGQKGRGNNKIIMQLGLEDLLKLKWVVDNELKRKEEVFEL